MKKIFRSIIDIRKDGKPTIEQEDLVRNYRAFCASNVQPEDPSYVKLLHWLEAHFRSFKEMPSVEYLYEKAKNDGNEAVMASIKDTVPQQLYIKSNYKAILKQKFDEQSKDGFHKVLTESWKIADQGLKFKRKELKGIPQAVEYFTAESRKFRLGSLDIKTNSNIISKEDGEEVIKGYRERKENPYANMGLYTYLDRIDEVFRGVKPGELMIIAAFIGQAKTTMAANLGYNGVWQGLNGLYVPLEMNFEEMRDMFYVLHSCNPEWFEHPKYKNLAGKISWEKVRYGELTEMEQEFFEAVSDDFPKREDFGHLEIYQPPESVFTPSKLELMMYDTHAKLVENGKALDFVIVDYVGLMVPDKADRYGDWNVDLNSIIKKLKQFCQNFDNGRGIRIISPFQCNRQGWKEAEKNDGVYKLTALSNANEAERSSDLVIAQYMSDDMRKSGTIKITCLKNRRGAVFSPFEAKIDFHSRHIRDYIQKKIDVSSDILSIPLDL